MGKIKTKRKKLHQKAAKATASSGKESKKVDNSQAVQMETSEKVIGGCEIPALFSKVDIDMNALTKHLPSGEDMETRSVITSKSFKGINIKKKDKRKLKHEFWMKKVNVLHTMKTEAKDKKRREKTVIVGDMKPLEDSLPTLDLLLRDCVSTGKEYNKGNSSRVKGIEKEHQRKKNMMSDISLFQQVLQHPFYKKNPRGTITEHLKNKLKQDQMDT